MVGNRTVAGVQNDPRINRPNRDLRVTVRLNVPCVQKREEIMV